MSKQTSVATVEPEAVPAPITPMQMLQVAVEQNADLDKLTKLMDLQERWEKNEARKAYVAALTTFKANAPTIIKDKSVSYGNTEYDHATLANVVNTIAPCLSEYGLSHQWSTDQGERGISVTCTLTHAQGHSDSVTLSANADKSGGKNDIQAIGSTVTYLQRYTLLAITGLAALDQDDDARTATRMTPSDRQKAGVWQGPLKVTALKHKMRDLDTALRNCASAADAQKIVDEHAEVLEQCKVDLPDWYAGGRDGPGTLQSIQEFLPEYDKPKGYEHIDRHGEHIVTYYDPLEYVQAIYTEGVDCKKPNDIIALWENNEAALRETAELISDADYDAYFTPLEAGYVRHKKGQK